MSLLCRRIVLDGAGQISFRVQKLQDPADARDGRLRHHDLSAVCFHSTGRGVQVVDNDRTFKTDHRLRRGIEFARLDGAERGKQLAGSIGNLAEVGHGAAVALKLPAENTAVEFSRPLEIIGVNRKVRKLTGHSRAPQESLEHSAGRGSNTARFPNPYSPLDVQIHHFQGVFFDKFAALLDVFAHERRENGLGRDGVLQAHFQQRARLGVHRGGPELLRVHFGQTFETRDGEIFLGVFQNIIQHGKRILLHDLVAIVGHREGRLVAFPDRLVEGAQALVVWRRCQRPVDAALAAVGQYQLVQAVLLIKRELGLEIQFGLLDRFHQLLQFLLVGEIGFLVEVAFGQQLDKFRIAQTATELRENLFQLLNVQKKLREVPAFQRFPGLALDDMLFGCALHQFAGKFALVADVTVHLAALDPVERRLGDVDVLLLDQFAHVAKKERQQQSANVAAVHVRVGHQDDFVIPQLACVEIVLADAGAKRRDDTADFLVAEHLVVAGLFDVQDLALERQDGLVAAVAPAFGRAAGGLSLDDEQLAARRIPFLAVGELPRQAAGVERRFAARQLARLARRFAGAGGVNALADDFSCDRGVLVEIFSELFFDQRFDHTLDIAIELALV